MKGCACGQRISCSRVLLHFTRRVRTCFVFFQPSILRTSTYLFLSLPPIKSRKSDPGYHRRLSLPLPITYGSCLAFLSREELHIEGWQTQDITGE